MKVPPEPARRIFGAELRQHRERAGLTQRDLALATHLSQTMISGLERAEKATNQEHIARIDAALNTKGALIQRWATLRNSGAPEWFRDIVHLEAEATGINMFHGAVFPGLLQTEDYAASVIRTGRPWYPPSDVARLAASRMERKHILDKEDKPLLWAIVDEAVLQRTVGDEQVMQAQLAHVLQLIESQKVQLQVLPTNGTLKPGLDGAFRIMTFRERPSIIYAEHVAGGEPVYETDTVAECQALYGVLQAESLPTAVSTDLIRKAHRGD